MRVPYFFLRQNEMAASGMTCIKYSLSAGTPAPPLQNCWRTTACPEQAAGTQWFERFKSFKV